MYAIKLPIEVIPKTRVFEPHLRVHVEYGRYILKTVDRVTELSQALSLRAKIFFEEYHVNVSGALDVDPFDFECDHLVIIDQKSNEVVGTYRLICSTFSQKFYSATEFEISKFLEAPGIKLELGRACIAKDHRRGAVLSLLWRGIIQYATQVKAEYLFGCSSVKSESKSEIYHLLKKFREEGLVSDEWGIQPLPRYHFDESEPVTEIENAPEVPSLLKSYFGAGAKVMGLGAWDRDFHCTDFFTVLKLSELAGVYGKRFEA